MSTLHSLCCQNPESFAVSVTYRLTRTLRVVPNIVVMLSVSTVSAISPGLDGCLLLPKIHYTSFPADGKAANLLRICQQQVCCVVLMEFAKRPDTTDFCHFCPGHGSSDATPSVRLLASHIAAKT